MHIRRLAANLVHEELNLVASVQGQGVVGNADGDGHDRGAVKDDGLGRHRDSKNLLSYMSTFNL